MRRVTRGIAAAGLVPAAALTAALVLAPVQAAASPGGVEVSLDGVTYSSSIPGALFTNLAHLVPGDTDQATFYLRNSSIEPGYLRITLRDVVSDNSDFANALTLGASTADQTGTSVSILEADPCWVMVEGQIVAPGEVVRVTTELSLGDLHGLAGQKATATAALGVALSGTAVQLPPTHCGKSETVLPVVPGGTTPTAPSSGTPGATAGVQATAGVEAPAGPVVPANPETDLPVLSPPTVLGIDPNTWHLLEEYLILVPIGASVVGGTAFGIVAWRRRNAEDKLEASV